ncbi:cytochrome P450 [Amycolatopsis sp. lyj-23]|uniref:cytochrome P450 n=1 Tax=Amycolatopsis sp. lyj-23 TaxID=2789283 RepID=UPI00397E4E4E
MQVPRPDLTDPALYASGDPHAAWRAQRGSCPVARHTAGGDPFWSVTGYAEGNRVLQDTATYRSGSGVQLRRRLAEPPPGAGEMLALSDAPRHGVLRAPLRKLFAAKTVAAWEPRIRTVVGSLLRPVVGAGVVDFVPAVAAPTPMAVLGDLLGVAPHDREAIAAAAFASGDESPDADGMSAGEAYTVVLLYFAELIEARRAHPADDVASALLGAVRDGAEIAPDEILLTCTNVLTAGMDTTKLAIGATVSALLEHPAAWASLRAGEVPLGRAVEEILRWISPATHVLRTASAAAFLGDVRISPGDPVAVWLPAVNRDPAVFDAPEELRLDRSPNPHRAFAAGAHVCLGASIVRLVLRVFLEELLATTGEVLAAGKQERFASAVLGGPVSLPVELRPR